MSAGEIRTGEPELRGVESDETALATAAHSPNTGRAPALASDFGVQGMKDLLHFAIERGTPVEQLEKLVDLADRMDRRQASRDFSAAMAAFQAECPAIKKGRTASIATKGGGKYQYIYADLDEIVHVVRPILTKHGLSFRFNTKHDGKLLSVECIVSHVNGHSEMATFTLPIDNPSAMSDQQKVGAAAMYAKRQSLSAALGITTTDQDVDGAAIEGADPTKITEDQVTALRDLIDETGASLDRFLDYMGAEKLEDLRAGEYQRAVNTLKQTQKRREKTS